MHFARWVIIALIVVAVWLGAHGAIDRAAAVWAAERDETLRTATDAWIQARPALVAWSAITAGLIANARRPAVAVFGSALVGLGICFQLGYKDPLAAPSLRQPGDFGATWAGWGAVAHVWTAAIGGAVALGLSRAPAVDRLPRLGLHALLAGAVVVTAATRWGPLAAPPIAGQYVGLRVGGHVVQAMELTKVIVALWLAAHLAVRSTRLRTHRVRIAGVVAPRVQLLGGGVLLLCSVSIAVLITRDLGVLAILGGTFIGLFYLAVGSRMWLAVGAAVLTGALALGAGALDGPRSSVQLNELTAAERIAQRLDVWLHPWTNGSSTQVADGLGAMGLGGWTGRGLGGADPRLVTNGGTDHAFAMLTENMGAVGACLWLGLFAGLVLEGLRIAGSAARPERTLAASGLTLLLLLQWWVIFAGTVGWVPLTGVVVPFLSAGAASLLTHYGVIGLLLGMAPTGRGQSYFDVEVIQRPLRDTAIATAAVIVAGAAQATSLATWRGAAHVSAPSFSIGRFSPPRLQRNAAGEVVGEETAVFAHRSRAMDAALPLAPRAPILDRHGAPLRDEPSTSTLLGRPTTTGWQPGWMLENNHAQRLSGIRVGQVYVTREGDRIVDSRSDPYPGATAVRVDDLSALLPIARANHEDRATLAAAMQADLVPLSLSIDADLQRAVYRELLDRHASGPSATAVVIDVDSGRMLVAAQARTLGQEATARVDDPYGPWFDLTATRRMAGSPGKLLTALAAGITAPDRLSDTWRCEWFGDRTGAQAPGWGRPVRDAHAGPVEGITLRSALADSRNCVFSQLATAIGPAAMQTIGDALGEPFDPGAEGSLDLALAGIGQGTMELSPRGVGRLVAAIGGGGVVRDCPLELDEPCAEHDLHVPDTALTLILDGMLAVTEEGTGHSLPSVPGVRIYGKSGTADEELRADERLVGITRATPHAWYVAIAEPSFAPIAARTPGRVAVVVLVPRGGGGAKVAGPIAVEIIRHASNLGLL